MDGATDASLSIALSRRFDARTGARPLDACLRWIRDDARLQHVVDVGTGLLVEHRLAFVALSHQRASATRHWYVYEALDVDVALREYADRPCSARHSHEIVGSGAPVKGYVDIDARRSASLDTARFDAYTRALSTRFAAAARRELGVARVCAAYFDASDDVKLSRHIVWALVDANDAPVAFRSAMACGRFVREHVLAADDAWLDMGVYNANHSLRMYGSTKHGEQRPFVALDANTFARRALAADGRLEWATLTASLVTLVAESARLVGADDVVARTTKKRARSAGTRLDPASLHSFVDELAEIQRAGGARSVRAVGAVLYVDTIDAVVCETKGEPHSSATVYYVVDTENRRYRQACHSAKCKRIVNRRKWLSFDQPFARTDVLTTLF